MAVDRIANFILSGIDNRFNMPDIGRSGMPYSDIGEVMLQRDFEPDIIEIPAFAFRRSLDQILNMMSSPEEERTIYKYINSIQVDSFGVERKQLNTILNDFTNRGYNPNLRRISNKGHIYYGYPGLVIDNNFNTLVCFKVRISKYRECIAITDYICYVSSKVFSNLDGIIEKAIYKKIIPFCASYTLSNDDCNNIQFYKDSIAYTWGGKHIEVAIKDNVECFIKSNAPSIDDFKDNTIIKDILLDNLDSFTWD